MFRPRLLPALIAIALMAFGSGCAAIQQIAALRSVDFAIDRVADVRLAGISMSEIRSYGDLGVLDIARLTAAISRRELPLSLTVHVAATNPADNSVSARLVGLDWALLLDNTETISGVFNDPRSLQPGVPADIPITVELNLIEFFDKSAPDLFNLVQAIAGVEGATSQVALRARPSVETALGPISYPNDITIVSREVGG